MLTTMHIRLIGNEDALLLMGLLVEAGIPRDRLRVVESPQGPEHRADPVLNVTLTWAVIGGVIGAVLGALCLWWWSLPGIGALWGGLVGAICLGRSKGNTAAHLRHEDMRLLPTWIEFDTEDAREIDHVHRIHRGHPQWEVTAAPTVLDAGPVL
jgi:hypothetical protein